MSEYTTNSPQTLTSWWKEKKDSIHEAVFGFIKFLDSRQGYRRADNLRHMRLYGNLKSLGLSAGNYSRTESDGERKNRVTFNIVQSACDTITNKITKNRPKIMFLTSGGDWGLQTKAKKLNKFVEGQFYATNLYELAPRIFLDGTVFDTGVMKVYENDGKICCERVFPDEIRVDDMEAVYGEPLQLHQEKDIPKETLIQMFPKFTSQIKDAKNSAGGMTGMYAADMIRVVESWRRKCSKKDQGYHSITIENATLLMEDYEKDYFPFVFLKWAQRLRGFYGQSLAERLSGKQLEINKILRTIQISQHLISVPKVLIDVSSDIVSAHLNNEIGGIIKYSGIKPDIINATAINPELYQHLKFLIQSSYQEAGISELAAQSQKPAGLNSGKALREFNDIESERFMLVGQAYEQFFMDAARQMIDLAKSIRDRDGSFNVMVKGKKFLETIDWKEIDLEEDQYVMQPYPTSFLSQTPSGKLQDVQDLVQAGFIDKDNGMRLLDFPDLEAFTSLATAALEDLDDVFQVMIEKGDYFAPEPFQNLQLGLQRCQATYLRAKLTHAPEDRLELLRRWMAAAQEMLAPPPSEQSPPSLPAPQVGPDGRPFARPMKSPVSDLLPFSPHGGVESLPQA